MAQLDVQPKQRSPVWIWIILVLVALGIVFMLMRGCSSPTPLSTGQPDSVANDTVFTGKNTPLATTQPDWSSVDFTIPKSAYDEITDTAIIVRGNQKYTIYSLGENVLFAKDDSKLQANASARLNQIVTSLQKRYKNASIGIYGHTDSTGTAGHNKALGAERANAVKDWLIENGGVDAEMVSVQSVGETKPLASNGTVKGKAQNRSVEIIAFPAGNSNQ